MLTSPYNSAGPLSLPFQGMPVLYPCQGHESDLQAAPLHDDMHSHLSAVPFLMHSVLCCQ